jgi:hypothetical protein
MQRWKPSRSGSALIAAHFGAPMPEMVATLTHPAAATEMVSMADCNGDRVPALPRNLKRARGVSASTLISSSGRSTSARAPGSSEAKSVCVMDLPMLGLPSVTAQLGRGLAESRASYHRWTYEVQIFDI